MNLVPVTSIQSMTPAAIDMVRRLEDVTRALPQREIVTKHVFHAGMYARTITIPPRTVLTGALIKRSTLLVLCGDVKMFAHDGPRRLTGYHVLTCSAGRKQAFFSYSETSMTMSFATSAKTVAEAEKEFTDEYQLLMSNNCENIVEETGQ